MLKNKKGILIFIVLLVVIYFAISIILSIPTGKKYNNTVFLGSSTKVEVKNGNIKVYNEDKKILKQNVKIYFRKKFVDGYIVSGEAASTGVKNSYYAYNKNNEYLSTGLLIAYTPDISIKIKESFTKEIGDISDIYDFIETSGLDFSVYPDLDYLNLDIIDIDDDGNEEYIYSLGIILEDTEDESDDEGYKATGKYYSFVFMKQNDKYILISKVESDYDGISNTRLYFTKLIDFNNDGNYEFVIDKTMGEYGPYYYELYSFGSNKFAKIGGE